MCLAGYVNKGTGRWRHEHTLSGRSDKEIKGAGRKAMKMMMPTWLQQELLLAALTWWKRRREE